MTTQRTAVNLMGMRTKKGISRSARSKGSRTASDPSTTLFRKHAARVRSQVAACRQNKNESITSTLAQWLTLHFTVTAQRLAEAAGEEGLPLEDLRKLTACLVALRKGEQAEQWMALERERLALAQESTKERMEAKFEKWVLRPEVQERFRKKKMTPEEKERAIKAVFGITDDHPNFRPPQPPPPPKKTAPEEPPAEGAAPPAPSPSNGSAPTLKGNTDGFESRPTNGSAPTPSGYTEGNENRPPGESAPTPPSPRTPPAISSAGPHWPTATIPILPPGGCYHFSSTSAFPLA